VCLPLLLRIGGDHGLAHTMCATEQDSQGVGGGEEVGVEVGTVGAHRTYDAMDHGVGFGESLHLTVGECGLGVAAVGVAGRVCDDRGGGESGGTVGGGGGHVSYL